MRDILAQAGAVALLLAGESLAVWAEVSFACNRSGAPLGRSILVHSAMMAVAIVGLLGGYRLCLMMLGNIWTVGVLSIVTILVAEPAATWIISGEPPTWRAVAGLMLGGLGLLVASSGP